MRQKIRQTLQDNEINYDENVLRITVDCQGQPTKFLNIIQLINDNIEEWTYEDEGQFKINIDPAYETIQFNL